jgi:hypothetical protein
MAATAAMINPARNENVPRLAISAAGAGASGGPAGLLEDLFFFGVFARLRANVVP